MPRQIITGVEDCYCLTPWFAKPRWRDTRLEGRTGKRMTELLLGGGALVH